ncbi:hypothetical protein Tco_0520287 [Tanacetum coccineum]
MYTHSKNDTTFKYVYVLKKETTVVDVEVHPPCSDHEDDDVIVISSDDEDDDVIVISSDDEDDVASTPVQPQVPVLGSSPRSRCRKTDVTLLSSLADDEDD